jgi:DnaJ-class molecular chaperone
MGLAMKVISCFASYLGICVVLSSLCRVDAFSPSQRRRGGHSPDGLPRIYAQSYAKANDDSSLLEDFRMASGEVVNPYSVLKVSRTASKNEIRRAYYEISRKYHPDGMRHRDILPGSCNNLDEVRDQWERIRFAYEILSNPKERKRYDRHEALADPKAAMQRAAVDAAFNGVLGVGKGIFGMGAFAVKKMTKKEEAETVE